MEQDDFYIVGIGASAGGMEALERTFSNIPADINAAFIVIQHITQEFKGLTRDLLSTRTPLTVQDAGHEMKIERGHVYFTPSHKTLLVSDGHFALYQNIPDQQVYQPIDIMLTSLGKNDKARAIGIILSGTGTDGSRGIRFIKENKGMVIAQQPASAQFNGMPMMAISSGHTDYILAPEDIGPKLVAYIEKPFKEQHYPEIDLRKEDEALTKIIELVSSFSNVDFGSYKISSLVRRIEKRIQSKELKTVAEYYQHLHQNAEELMVLYASLMIGVTSFFRDPEAFGVLESKVIPEICKSKKDYETIRIWVAGCSTGEEAYSLAMLFEEYITTKKLNLDYKIFATDLDPKAIEFAGIGKYTSSIEAEVSWERLTKHFTKTGDFYDIKKNIRKRIIFVRHNVLKDPPFIRLDMVTCRNLFIYLKAEAQKKVLWDFHFSLKPEGFLFLGHNESLEEPEKLFVKIDPKWKIYRNKPGTQYRPMAPHELSPSYARGVFPATPSSQQIASGKSENYAEMLAERYAPPCIMINEANELVYTNGNIEKYLHIPRKRTSLNIFKMVNKDLALIFRNGIRKVGQEVPEVFYKDVAFDDGTKQFSANIFFRKLSMPPLYSQRSAKPDVLVLVEFQEVQTRAPRLDAEEHFSDHFSQEHIEELERELELTKKELQYTVQEIETINEELQASNEEMTSANEELQSTNEELQSSNEELFSVNMELKTKVDELTVLNNDINNLFKSTDIAIIFLDENLNIRKFTPAVKDHLNLLDSDIGRPISHLSTNFDYNSIIADAGRVLSSLGHFEKEIINNNGRHYLMRILPYKTEEMYVKGVVITFIDITEVKKQTEEIIRNNTKLKEYKRREDESQ